MTTKVHKDKPVRKTTADPYGHKVHSLSAQLFKLASERGVGAKLPTIRELSDQYQTSSISIDNALTDLEARNVIYRKRGSGIYVSPKIHRKTIAIVFNSTLLGANASPFWGTLLGQFAVHAERRRLESDQDFEFFMTPPSPEVHGFLPEHLMKAVRAGAINGAVGISLSKDSTQWLLDQGVPCSAYAGWSTWTVATSSERFIESGLLVLANQGCRRIEYWGLPRQDDRNSEWYKQTCAVIETAYTALGLEPPQTWIGPADDLLTNYRLPDGERSNSYQAYTAIKALYADLARTKPDGIFISDDTMANGVLLGLMEAGVHVGTDIKIVSQANRMSPILCGTNQYFTLLETDPGEAVEALFQLLDQAMEDPDLPEAQISVPWRVQESNASI